MKQKIKLMIELKVKLTTEQKLELEVKLTMLTSRKIFRWQYKTMTLDLISANGTAIDYFGEHLWHMKMTFSNIKSQSKFAAPNRTFPRYYGLVPKQVIRSIDKSECTNSGTPGHAGIAVNINRATLFPDGIYKGKTAWKNSDEISLRKVKKRQMVIDDGEVVCSRSDDFIVANV
ncbi:unnamed protein product [Nesidiocoris tenuis]|uniref:Uncharacterized protein n=1 Tax=Nesidiocoris tenuis TaxID=355587 RepID=A0A6H5GQ18_9HEMI|nr:unnamed protein product [Nesidiocoris tenuis]